MATSRLQEETNKYRICWPEPISVRFRLLQPAVVVVVGDDSHIQRIVLATEETTVTQQDSHR